MWIIIKNKIKDKIEYQVSDGVIGKRTMSYDTYDKKEAIKICKIENGKKDDTR